MRGELLRSRIMFAHDRAMTLALHLLLAAAWGFAIWSLFQAGRARWPEAVALLAVASLAQHWPPKLGIVPAIEALAILAGIYAMFARGAGRGARFSEEEAPLVAALPGLSPPAARHLIDQGVWVAGREGEVLIDEWKPIANLYFLERGSATVSVAGRSVGMCRAGQFAGEVTVLSGDPATATVTLAEPSRMWCIEAAKLRDAAALHADVHAAVEAAIVRSLTDKLVETNRSAARDR